MPRTTTPTKASISTAEKIQDEFSAHKESSSSDQEQDPGVLLQLSQAQILPNMFMPYIEGPKMDWTVNDGLYHRFLKWHLKCENILERELAMLPEKRQYKKVIAWSGDKFPTRMVRQLAKKMESSKVTARHIKQVGNDTQAAQINLMRHQHTDLPAS